MQGNVVMLIWLGKQYLGQAEKIDETGDMILRLPGRLLNERNKS